jgi:hypothetical protein
MHVQSLPRLHIVSTLTKEAPSHLGSNECASCIEFVVDGSVCVEKDTLITKVRLDDIESKFNRVIVGRVRGQVFHKTA